MIDAMSMCSDLSVVKKGAHGEVSLVRRQNSIVAVKTAAKSPEALNELHICLSLQDHPGIIKILDSEISHDQVITYMEYHPRGCEDGIPYT